MRKIMAMGICLLASACQAYGAAIDNGAGHHIDLTVTYRDGRELKSGLAANQRLMLWERLSEVETIAYRQGDANCVLIAGQFASEPLSPQTDHVVISRCPVSAAP